MELEEMKNTWKQMNDKLEEDRLLKESLILEMIHAKADKSVNKLLNSDIISVCILLLLIPLMAYCYYRFNGKFIMWDIYIIYTMFICVMGFCWTIYKIRELMKVDLSKNVSENIYHTNRYNIWTKREMLITQLVFGPVFVLLAIFMFIEMKARWDLWIFLLCMVALATVGSYWSYKRIYDKNLSSILQSLNEIKELKEE